jgi:hypothetical protein
MANLATQDAPFGLNQVTFTPGERSADRLFEGEEAVLHVMGWVGGRVGAPTPVTRIPVCAPHALAT